MEDSFRWRKVATRALVGGLVGALTGALCGSLVTFVIGGIFAMTNEAMARAADPFGLPVGGFIIGLFAAPAVVVSGAVAAARMSALPWSWGAIVGILASLYPAYVFWFYDDSGYWPYVVFMLLSGQTSGAMVSGRITELDPSKKP